MAVQAQYLTHAFLHEPRVIRALDNATSGSVLLDDAGGGLLAAAPAAQQVVVGNTVFSNPHSELTCNNNSGSCFVPRKRARVGEGVLMDGNRTLLPPVPQAFVPSDVQSRVVASGTASTSGRPANAAPVSHGLLSHLCRQNMEIDALVRLENERLRMGLEEARRRHVRAVVSAVERAAAQRLQAAEAELQRALCRNAELEEKVRQMGAEGQAWQGIAKSHEAIAVGLRATLDQLLQSPCAGADEGDAEDAQSCCFEKVGDADGEVSGGRSGRACKACGEGEACMLLLPCRHLCLCRGCEAAVDACPVCAARKNGSLHVLLP